MKSKLVIALMCSVIALFAINSAIAQTGTTQAPSTKSTTTGTQTKKENKKKTPEQKAEQQAKEMQIKLELSDQQTKQVEGIFLKGINSKNQNANADTKAIRKEANDEIMKVLTPDQQKKYKELKKEKRKEKKTHDKDTSK